MPSVLLCLWCCVAFAPTGVPVSLWCCGACADCVSGCAASNTVVWSGARVSVVSVLLGHTLTAASRLVDQFLLLRYTCCCHGDAFGK